MTKNILFCRHLQNSGNKLVDIKEYLEIIICVGSDSMILTYKYSTK